MTTIKTACLHRLLACLAPLALVPTSELRSQPDPLERVEAYSLNLSSTGQPLAGYFPIGMRPGLPRQALHAGFNVWQREVDNNQFKTGAPFQPMSATTLAEHDTYGFLYYTQARAANSFWKQAPLPPGVIGGYGNFPAVIQEDEVTPLPPGLSSASLFHPGASDYFNDFMAGLAASSTGSAPVGRPTLFWGMDNEWEGLLDYSPEAKSAFAAWLPGRFTNIAELNAAWGTSHASFAAIASTTMPKPSEFATKPGAFLAWHTFQSEAFTQRLADMAHELHTSDPHSRPVVFKSTQQTIETPYQQQRKLYSQALFGELSRPVSGGLMGVNIYAAGDKRAYETSYIYNVILPPDRSRGHGVMCPEMNNGGSTNPGYGWGATFWRALGNGLKAGNFFCTGYPGATGDYDNYGHIRPDGVPRDKLFYAARWAHMVHRTETLWQESMPAPGTPRVALLMPRRDAILSPRSDRGSISAWTYPRNNRLFVYTWLREQGYWVDVIPETKLDADYLSAYGALFLVGAEHLTAAEAGEVEDYVNSGGVLVADLRTGLFDELHRTANHLGALLGVTFGSYAPNDRFTLPSPLAGAQATGRLNVTATTATPLMTGDGGRTLATTRAAGSGRVYHLAFELGDLRESSATAADIAPWLASLLQTAGVQPAYEATNLDAAQHAAIRVEQPMVDSLGNVAVVAGVRGDSNREVLPGMTLELYVPGGPWTRAAWGESTDAGVQVLPVTHLSGDRHRVTIPAADNAGVLYFLKDHAPLVGIPEIPSLLRSVDGHGARLRRGVAHPVKVQLVNPMNATVPAGTLRLAAVQGWTVSPASAATGTLAAGQTQEITFTVTPGTSVNADLNWLYPLVARWATGGTDHAIGTANVEVHDPIIIDNTDPSGVTLTGSWTTATATDGYYGSNYLHDGNTGAGKSVRFTPTIPAGGGVYAVYTRWPAGSNRATNAPIGITHAGGVTTIVSNQRHEHASWVFLGTYALDAGTSGHVTIRNQGADGYVMVDAVMFDPVTTPAPAAPTTVTLTSIAAEDGWIIESAPASGLGGSKRSGDSNASALRLGDNNANCQYRSVLSFDTSAIPDDAVILSATVRMTRGSISGTHPFTHLGTLGVDVCTGNFGGSASLDPVDFQAPATAPLAATMSNPAANGDASSGTFDPTGRLAINLAGRTQLRLAFAIANDGDSGNDYLGFYAGEDATPANRPTLEITYQ